MEKNYALGVWNALKKERQVILKTEILEGALQRELLTGEVPPSLVHGLQKNGAAFDAGQKVFYERFLRPGRVILLGGGHIAKFLSELLGRLGFFVIVADDREEFAQKERFPFAKQVLCASFDESIRRLSLREEDAVVLFTRGHCYDEICLRALSRECTPFYLGLLGAKRRTSLLFEQLKSEGIPAAFFDEIHTPIGLSIGARTPMEIALAIAAELIKERSLHGLTHADYEQETLQEIAGLTTNFVLLTILSTDGSSPRRAGACMAVLPDGRLLGTIGGGSLEGRCIALAKELTQGTYRIYEAALDEGESLCGGKVKVLLEYVEEEI